MGSALQKSAVLRVGPIVLKSYQMVALTWPTISLFEKGLPIMDFITIAKTRSSIRSYTDQKVEPEKLEKILE